MRFFPCNVLGRYDYAQGGEDLNVPCVCWKKHDEGGLKKTYVKGSLNLAEWRLKKKKKEKEVVAHPFIVKNDLPLGGHPGLYGSVYVWSVGGGTDCTARFL